MAKKKEEESKALRTPIVCVMGHVDHGKTTLLDRIRGTAVAEREAGAITQHIGATEVPIEVIDQVTSSGMKDKFAVPGLLFIDTPGHHAFTTLRSRGGALADLAVVIIDINDGFQPQTIETLEILKRYRTPFVVVANKIDRIHGWQAHEGATFSETYQSQSQRVRDMLDEHMYEIIGDLHNHGFSSDRYDRVRDFQKNVGVIPISAKTGEGVPDLLMVLVGLAQRFLEKNLEYRATGPGVGTVLEVKEERGFGTTLDVILYEGEIKVGDIIVVAGLREPIVTKVRALLKPRPLAEIREEERFERVEETTAALGIKIAAPDLEGTVSGSPLMVAEDEDALDEIISEVQSQLEEVRVPTDTEGVYIKADTIGSLEALGNELQNAEIPIRRADVGDVSRRDVIEASATKEMFHRVILAFDVDILPDAKEEIRETGVKVFQSDIIYKLLEDYEEWMEEQERRMEQKRLEKIIRPGMFRILPGNVFRQSKPAIVGIHVIGGIVRTNTYVMREDGVRVGVVKGLQERGENISEARAGDEVAIAIDGPTVGRQIDEGDTLLVDVPEKHAKVIEQEMYDTLSTDELEALDELLEIKRRENPFWAK